MGDLVRMHITQIGLHSSATDFSGAPTFTAIEPTLAGIMPMDTERNERDLERGDNGDYASAVGVKMLDEIVVDILARGSSGNTGGAVAALTATEIGILFEAIFGAASVDAAGAATTVTGDTGASKLLAVTSDTNLADGGGVLFNVGSDYIAREQVSKAANVLTLDRTWVDGAPGSDNVPYKSCHWLVDPTIRQHKHIGIRGVGSNWERTYLGCGIQSVTISGEEGKPVKISTKWKPTDWSDTNVGPSFSAPTAGDYVVSTNSRLFIGDESFMFKKWSIELGYVVRPRETSSGPNAMNGYLVTRKSPSFKGTCYFGTGGAGPTNFGEIADSSGNISLNKIQGLTNSAGTAITPGKVASTYDCALQIGNAPGACMYFRIPATELSGKMENDNGVEVIAFTGKARRPATGSMMRVHVY